MSKRKHLSRNKTIKILHEMTLLSYKTCRDKLKACDWDLGTALGGTWCKQLEKLSLCLDDTIEAIYKAAEAIGKVIKESADFAQKAILEAIKEGKL